MSRRASSQRLRVQSLRQSRIHVFTTCFNKKDVAGRDKPGHDDVGSPGFRRAQPKANAPHPRLGMRSFFRQCPRE
jgi:hypothetical protein